MLDILRASERPLRPSELWEKAEVCFLVAVVRCNLGLTHNLWLQPLGLKSKQHMKKTLHQLKGMNKAAAKPLEEPKKGRVPFGWVVKGRAKAKPCDAGTNPGAVKAAGSKQGQTQHRKASKQPAEASQDSRTDKDKKEQASWWNRFV